MRQIAAFYADPHFGHSNILKYCNRPFDNLEEMHGELIDRYNDVIKENETVLWVGDCFFRGTHEGILEELNGTKILVIGNHDKPMSAMAKIGFAMVLQEAVIDIAGFTCRVSHYPYKPEPTFEKPDKFSHLRPRQQPGEILIHGHSHRNSPVHDNQIDVGVDAWDYGPALYDDVESLVKQIKGVKS